MNLVMIAGETSAAVQRARPIDTTASRTIQRARQQVKPQESAPADQAAPGVGKFHAWLKQTRFLDQINRSNRSYTVVIPTDTAVDKLPTSYIDNLEANPKRLQALLMYHIIPGAVDVNLLKDEALLKTVGK